MFSIVLAAYNAAAVLFILSLGGLSGQESAKRAVWHGMTGMVLATRDRQFVGYLPTPNTTRSLVATSAPLQSPQRPLCRGIAVIDRNVGLMECRVFLPLF